MPTYRPTNGGLQTKGALWGGFDPTLSAIIAGVFMVSVMATFGAIAILKIAWALAISLCFLLPNLSLLGVVFTLILGKPPRYLQDWFGSRVLGRSEIDAMRLPVLEAPELDP